MLIRPHNKECSFSLRARHLTEDVNEAARLARACNKLLTELVKLVSRVTACLIAPAMICVSLWTAPEKAIHLLERVRR